MNKPIPLLVVCWLFLTCWTTSSNTAAVTLAEVGDARQQRDLRRIDPVPDPGDWKPIDYGHPMRDDPTLVYVPPVVDPIHYGIHSAEPLWPIQGSKLPPFRLPPEAMLAAASSDRRWRPRPASKPKDVTLPRTSIQPSQQRLDLASNLLVQRPSAATTAHHHHQVKKQDQHGVKPQYLRHPVKSTAWKSYDRSTNRPIGRSPAVADHRTPAVVPSLLHPPVTRPGGHHWTRHQASVRPKTQSESRPSNRFFGGASSGRSFGNNNLASLVTNAWNLESGRSFSAGISNSNNHHSASSSSSQVISSSQTNKESKSIDRLDDNLLLNHHQKPSVGHEDEDEQNETLLSKPTTTVTTATTTTTTANHQQRKRARRPFSPLEFVIQQGHSRVRKYGVEK